MTDIIEIMARAMCLDDGNDPDADFVGGAKKWEAYAHDAGICVAALTEAGFAIVPVEPTEAMADAGYGVLADADDRMLAYRDASDVYRAMIQSGRING